VHLVGLYYASTQNSFSLFIRIAEKAGGSNETSVLRLPDYTASHPSRRGSLS